MAVTVAELLAKLHLDSSGFVAGLNSAKAALASVAGAAKQAGAGVGAGFGAAGKPLDDFVAKTTKMGANITKVGSSMLAIGAPMALVGGMAVKMGNDFELAMSRIEGLVGESRQQVAAWSSELLKLGPEIGKSPKELADALYFVTSSGIHAGEAMDVLTTSAKASAAGLGQTKTVADAVTSVINAYGAANINAGKAAGIMIAAVREGKAEPEEFAGALGRVIPIAANMGVSFDQVSAAVASMSKQGLDAFESTTALRGIFATLLKPAKQSQEALADMGLSASGLRQQLKEKGLLSVLGTLAAAFNTNEDAAGKVIPNVRALTGFLNLEGNAAAENASIFAELATSGSADLDKAFGATAATNAFKFQQAMAAVKASLTELGMALAPVVSGFIQPLISGLTALFGWFAKLPKGVQSAVVAFTGILLVGGALAMLAGKIISGLAGMAAAFGLEAAAAAEATAATVAFEVATGPIGIALMAVAAAAAIFIGRHKEASESSKAFAEALKLEGDAAKVATEAVIAKAFGDKDATAAATRLGVAHEAITKAITGTKKEYDAFIKTQQALVDAGVSEGEYITQEAIDAANLIGVTKGLRKEYQGKKADQDATNKANEFFNVTTEEQAALVKELTAAMQLETAARDDAIRKKMQDLIISQDMAGILDSFGITADALTKAVQGEAWAQAQVTAAIGSHKTGADKLAKVYNTLLPLFAQATTAATVQKKVFAETTVQTERQAAATALLQGGYEGLASKMDAIKTAGDKLRDANRAQGEAQEKLTKATKTYNDLLAGQGAANKKYEIEVTQAATRALWAYEDAVQASAEAQKAVDNWPIEHQKALTDALRATEDAFWDLESAELAVSDAERNVEKAHRAVDAALRNETKAANALAKANKKVDQLRADQLTMASKIKEAWKGTDESLSDFAKTIKSAIEASLNPMKKIDAIADAQREMADAANTVKEAEHSLFDAMAKAAPDYKEVENATKGLNAARKKAVETAEALGARGLRNNLTANNAALKKWLENLKNISGRGFGDLARELAKLGPEGAAAVQELAMGSDSGLKEMTGLFKERSELMSNEFAVNMSKALGDTGVNLDYLNGLEKDAQKINEDLADAVEAVADAAWALDDAHIAVADAQIAESRAARDLTGAHRDLDGAMRAVTDANMAYNVLQAQDIENSPVYAQLVRDNGRAKTEEATASTALATATATLNTARASGFADPEYIKSIASAEDAVKAARSDLASKTDAVAAAQKNLNDKMGELAAPGNNVEKMNKVMSDLFGTIDSIVKISPEMQAAVGRMLGPLGDMVIGSHQPALSKGIGRPAPVKFSDYWAMTPEQRSKVTISSVPGAAAGGVVTKPTLLHTGERYNPEAIIPLDKLPGMIGQMTTGGGGDTFIHQEIHGSVVTERQAVAMLHEGLLGKKRRGGNLKFN